ncbi:MAG: peptidoglycan DD-metalloendopeptidase family protein [Lysobacteraceae bacterium]
MPSLHRHAKALLLALSLSVGLTLPAHAEDNAAQQAEAEQKLKSIRAQIAEVNRALDAIKAQQDTATKQLREADKAVASASRTLQDTDTALDEQQQKLDALETQRSELGQRLGKQRESLSALLRLAYAMGRDQRLKLLLAQDRLDEAARALAYQRYFQRDQVERIRQLLADLDELRALGEAVAEQSRVLDAARAEQTAALEQLQQERGEQQKVVDALAGQYQDGSQRLKRLADDEKALVALIARLTDIFADIPRQAGDAQPITQQKGRLPWPLEARIRVGFGGTLPDGRTSRGWLLDASAGSKVQAVAAGRVAFSDWLRGYGLLVILDHGDGYMSLYAQNEALLREVGDWVGAGEIVSSVGRSGGQSVPGLYFELRHRSKPVDPRTWLQRR